MVSFLFYNLLQYKYLQVCLALFLSWQIYTKFWINGFKIRIKFFILFFKIKDGYFAVFLHAFLKKIKSK